MNGPMGVGGKVQGLSQAGSIESVVVFEAIDAWEARGPDDRAPSVD